MVFRVGYLILICALTFEVARSDGADGTSATPATLPAASQPSSIVKPFMDEHDFSKCYQTVLEWERVGRTKKADILKELSEQVTSGEIIELIKLEDNFIVPRPNANHFQGHGSIVRQDVFIRGGKAAWAIEQLLNIQLHPITEKMTKEELEGAVREAQNCVASYRRGLEDSKTIEK
ncbi:MAG: hypothetical protein K8T89_14105 [Planctomycetes bacterium]|nr:hypothetical protein [Planctomycetota bacterium]